MWLISRRWNELLSRVTLLDLKQRSEEVDGLILQETGICWGGRQGSEQRERKKRQRADPLLDWNWNRLHKKNKAQSNVDFWMFSPYFWSTLLHPEVKKGRKKIIVCLLNNQIELVGGLLSRFAVFVVEKRLHHCVLTRMLKVEGC